MVALVRRWVAGYRLGRSVDIWYHPEYVAESLAELFDGAMGPIHRGQMVLAALEREGLVDPARVSRPEPATILELSRFHTLPYLESTNDPESLGRVFGLEPQFVDIDAFLRASLRATGGTIAAARRVVGQPGKLAFNLGGGFHHARADMGTGFSIHNDVAVALATLRAEGFGGRVLIVDLDYHQGDGFIESFATDPSVLVYSIHGSVWSHVETRHRQFLLSGRVGDRRYLRTLRRTLPRALADHQPELVFYVAGNDVMAGDRLGTFDLTLQGVLDRDRFVLDTIRLRSLPMVAVIAGGYSRDAWRGTNAMIRYALTGHGRVDRRDAHSLQRRFAAIAAKLDPAELQGGAVDDESFKITEEDLFGELYGTRRNAPLLDYYSAHGVELALTRYGLTDALHRRGFERPRVQLDTSDRSHQIIRVHADRRAHKDLLVVELVVRRQWIKDPSTNDERLEMLAIEWLLLQDPSRSFSLARPPLPGQRYPGLGVSAHLRELLVVACRRLSLHGLIEHPAYFHTAYGSSQGGFLFLRPEDEGRYRALKAALPTRIEEASWALERGAVQWGDGETAAWQTGLQVMPISDRLTKWFGSSSYLDAVREHQSAVAARGIHTDLSKGGVPMGAVVS